MGALAGFLVSVFSGLFSFLATYLGKKFALGTAVLASLAALTIGFYVAIKALVVGLVSQITHPVLLMGFYVVWPSNADACIAAVLSAEVTAFIYRMHVANVKALSNVS